jgi:hypothetical protein
VVLRIAGWGSVIPHVLPSTLFCRLLASGMVNYNDPLVLESDLGAHPFHPDSSRLEGLMRLSLNSGAQKFLAHHKWSLHVGLFRQADIPLSCSSSPAGNL